MDDAGAFRSLAVTMAGRGKERPEGNISWNIGVYLDGNSKSMAKNKSVNAMDSGK